MRRIEGVITAAAILGAASCGPERQGQEGQETIARTESPIINGTTVTNDDIGFVRLSFLNAAGQGGRCSGTALAPQWVLTAKHCPASVNNDPTVTKAISFGTSDLATPIVASNVFVDAQNDAALIRLSQPLPLMWVQLNLGGVIFTLPQVVMNTMWNGPLSAMPGFGSLRCFGYGAFTTDSSNFQDGILRTATLPVGPTNTSVEYVLNGNSANQGLWLGDSGGTCVVDEAGRSYPAGIHSSCLSPSRCFDLASDQYRTFIDATLFEPQIHSEAGPASIWPPAVSTKSGRIDQFVNESSTGTMQHRVFQNGAWSATENIGTVVSGGAPASVSWDGNRIDVVTVTFRSALYHKWCNGDCSPGSSAWPAQWEDLSGNAMAQFSFGPALSSWGSGRLDVFAVRGQNLLHRVYDLGKHLGPGGSDWTDWTDLGCCVSSTPAAASWSSGRLDVVARGTDSAIWHRWCTNGVCATAADFAGWESLGGVATSAPTMVSRRAGQLDIFVRTFNNFISHRIFDGRWGDWAVPGSVVYADDPKAVPWNVASVKLYSRDANNGGVTQQYIW
jgi:hypothetical protein